MLQGLRDDTEDKLGRYIRRDKSVKISTKIALDEHHKMLHDAQMTAEELKAAKENEHAHPEEESKNTVQNPKSINPKNKLQMALVKYT